MATEYANRGKWAEGKVKEYCDLRSAREAGFSVHRFADMHAGSAQPAPSDYMMLLNGTCFMLEVKEVKHEFRVPKKNYLPDKVARMRKWQLAGAQAWVLIYFEPLGVAGRGWRDAKAWRVVPIDKFLEQGPSWDLSAYDLVTFSAGLDYIFGQG